METDIYIYIHALFLNARRKNREGDWDYKDDPNPISFGKLINHI